MCGIVGYLGLELDLVEGGQMLERMCRSIRHRGPDDQGFYVGSEVGLGMQRLSIVDLEHGQQPMASAEGHVQVVFNGEIYNHGELRDGLRRDGDNFATRCDTEVVLRQYLATGIDGVRQFNGMFAIAIWDERKRVLYLVRDRLGVKPLYYAWNGRQLLFGSEIKALLASEKVDRQLEPCALWDYLTFRYIPAPKTIWQRVHKLPPGHVLSLDLDCRQMSVKRYWDIPYPATRALRRDDAYDEEFATLFEDAVRLRMIADVPVGILLSGGLDSSCVAAAATALRKAPVSTFSVAFADSPAMDERVYAREVATALGTEHHEIVIDEREFVDFLDDFVYLTDEPLADLASTPLYFVCRLAREHVKVVLSGEGSDEILGGYDFDRVVAAWEKMRRARGRAGWLGGLRTAGLLARVIPSIREWYALAVANPDQRVSPVPLSMTNYMDSAAKRRLFASPPACTDSLDVVRQHLARLASHDPLDQCLYVYSQDWLVEDLLMKADRMSMANSLELRTPFLDYRVVEWAAKAPPRIKVGRDAAGVWQTKRVLRRYAAGRLPQSVIDRPKQGFPVPVYGWLRDRLRDWIGDLLGSQGCELRRFFDSRALGELVGAGLRHDADMHDQHRLWNLAVLEIWARRWKPA